MRGKIIGISIAVIIGLVALGWGIRWVVAPIEGHIGAREQIFTPTSIIGNYNHFFDLCASIQTKEGTISAQLARTDNSPHIQQNVAALQSVRLADINQYNADAAKNYTAGQFRSAKLPYHIPAKPYDGTNPTTCTVQ